ncbi:hypothetical protein CDIK_3612 [Cucumispora dikerogammari]|nr:hypothetical protein CDIK_3612 [Cucumispora dikerogammari]
MQKCNELRKFPNPLWGGYYRCHKRTCITKMSLFKNKFFNEPKVEAHLFLRVIFGYCIYLDLFQLEFFSDLSRSTLIKIKKNNKSNQTFILGSIDCDNPVVKIGGLGTFVQIDETVICKGRTILNPSSAYDDIKGAQWLVGCVTEGVKKEFFICLVLNRQIATLAVFSRNICYLGQI